MIRYVHRLWFRCGEATPFCTATGNPLLTWDLRKVTCRQCLR